MVIIGYQQLARFNNVIDYLICVIQVLKIPLSLTPLTDSESLMSFYSDRAVSIFRCHMSTRYRRVKKQGHLTVT